MTRPCFLNSKGERGKYSGFETDDLEERYINAFTGHYVYDGLPEGCPDDYIERAFYFTGCVSGKKVRGLGPVIMGAAPSSWTTYGTPVGWLPNYVVAGTTGPISGDIFKESKNPCLYEWVPMRERVRPYLEVMRKALNALNVNLVGLTNPVVIEAAPGLELQGKIIKNNLGGGDVYLPVVNKGAIGASVLDLKAADHTANLLGVIHDMDSEILDMMGIRSALEKASGISVEEASASDMQIREHTDLGLRMREQWLEKLNAVLGTEITVRPAEGWDAPDMTEEDDQEGEDADRGSDEAAA